MSNAPSIAVLDHIDLHLKSDAGDIHILKDISATIDAGRTISITGPSGSGKTTLLMVLSGLEKPSAGRVTVAGTDMTAMDEDSLATFRRLNIGIVFQNFHLIPTMTALENVAIPLELAGDPDAFKKAADALSAVNLSHRLQHYPGQMSGGEQQRVAIARATVAKPKLILADEPTGNLDATTGKIVIDLLFRLTKDTGATLLLITHDADLAGRCDAALHIQDGRLA